MVATSIFDMAAKRRKTHKNKNLTKSVLFGMIAVGIVFSGCTLVGPDYVKPTAPEAKEWLETGRSQNRKQGSRLQRLVGGIQ